MVWLPQDIDLSRGLGGLPAAVAGDFAFRLFCTPALSERRRKDHRHLAERARFHLRSFDWPRIATPVGAVQAYIAEPDDPRLATALLVHGWTSEASFMTAIAEPLRRAGYRVVLFDLPAHGLSQGRATTLMDCARATTSVGHALGPIDIVVTHSFGAMTALVASEGLPRMPHDFRFSRLIMIAPPNRLSDVTRDFGRHFGLRQDGQRAFEQRLERIGQRPMHHFTTAKLLDAAACPALVLHARDDRDVPFSSALEIAAAVQGTVLQSFDGLGHSAMLFAPPVMRKIVGWLRPPQPTYASLKTRV